ncbi:hypothetical protein H4R18_001800 [Coemansia javaensis]|uniref:PIG-P domain-containing protein n=1 Tax=Coemansia javaensis TaxID=2761396 RepID=A0A9W8HCP8_9FUNG|nr:hypothetical protein H4R18_001800 [Coemansia javaensis]
MPLYTSFGHARGTARRRASRSTASVAETAASLPPHTAPASRLSVGSTLQGPWTPLAPARPDADAASASEPPPSLPESSAADAPAATSTPTFEYYGFVVYLVSLAAFAVYLLWAYLPDQALEAVGITYYPDRYWAVALPAWWLMAVAFICLFNVAMNMYNTPLLSSMDNIADPFSNLPPADADGFYCYDEVGGIPPVGDIPVSLVNRCLYQ